MGGGIEAGKAFVKFLLEDSALKKGLRSTGAELTKWGKRGAAATAPVLAALTGCVAAAISVGGEFADMSARTGVGVEALSELKFAAEQTGTSMGSVEAGIKKMQRGIAAAQAGTGTFGQSLSMLGIDLRMLAAQSPEQQFTTLATAIAAIEDPTQRAAMAQQVFGRSGTALLPMITDVSGGVAGLREKARELGVTLTEEDAAACDQLGDALDGAKSQVMAMAVQIGVAIAGPLTEFLTWAQTILSEIIAWIQANPELVQALAALTLGIAGASTAAIAFGTILAIISAHPIIAALTAIAGLVSAIATYFGWASSGARKFKAEAAKIKAEGAKIDAEQKRQADDVMRRLQGAGAGPAPSVGPAAASRGEVAATDDFGAVVKWTKATADGINRLITIAQTNGGFVGGTG